MFRLTLRLCTLVGLCAQFKYWSPLPSEPEKKLPVDPETATASCSSSLARLAVTGGVHVGWKSTATGASVVTWQVRFVHECFRADYATVACLLTH